MLRFYNLSPKTANIIILNRDEKRRNTICQVMMLIDDVVYVDASCLMADNANLYKGFVSLFKSIVNYHKENKLPFYSYEDTLLFPLTVFYELANKKMNVFEVDVLSRFFQNTMQLVALSNEFSLEKIAKLKMDEDYLLARYMKRQHQLNMQERIENIGDKSIAQIIDELTEELKQPIPTKEEFLEGSNVTTKVMACELKLNILQKLFLMFF